MSYYYEVNVLVNGRRATTYEHNGETYFEGRPGTEYELELVNRSSTDAEFVVSIDGLSINDGQPAGRESKGYIISAYGSSRIKGWLLNTNQVAAFKFGAKGKSYAAQSEQGDAKNTGVIGLQVFPRKYVAPPVYARPSISDTVNWGDDYRSQTRSMFKGITSQDDRPRGIAPSGAISKGVSMGYADPGPTASMMSFNACASVGSNFESSVGTEFGRSTEMKTTKVSFDRASDTPSETIVLYYGDSKDLNRLGIQLDWQKTPKATPRPNPFPADGYCKPPANWNG
jgi:hypothetical protein